MSESPIFDQMINDPSLRSAEYVPNDLERDGLDPRVLSLAADLAADYGAQLDYTPTWRGWNGERELRDKTPEQAAALGHGVGGMRPAVIDIASTPFDKMSPLWRGRQIDPAQLLIGTMDEVGGDAILRLDLGQDADGNYRYDDPEIARLGQTLHTNWLDSPANAWVKDPTTGDADMAQEYFRSMSDSNKKKDIDQLRVLQVWLRKQSQDAEATSTTT